jgi:hypothetical protein
MSAYNIQMPENYPEDNILQQRNCSPAASFADCYDIIPVKSASANISFYTNNSKMPNFEL